MRNVFQNVHRRDLTYLQHPYDVFIQGPINPDLQGYITSYGSHNLYTKLNSCVGRSWLHIYNIQLNLSKSTLTETKNEVCHFMKYFLKTTKKIILKTNVKSNPMFLFRYLTTQDEEYRKLNSKVSTTA